MDLAKQNICNRVYGRRRRLCLTIQLAVCIGAIGLTLAIIYMTRQGS